MRHLICKHCRRGVDIVRERSGKTQLQLQLACNLQFEACSKTCLCSSRAQVVALGCSKIDYGIKTKAKNTTPQQKNNGKSALFQCTCLVVLPLRLCVYGALFLEKICTNLHKNVFYIMGLSTTELPKFAFQSNTQPIVVLSVALNIATVKNSKGQVDRNIKLQKWSNMDSDSLQSL